jgi:acetylornithine/succinyldiaminopimelate/putrescine aminotransferase
VVSTLAPPQVKNRSQSLPFKYATCAATLREALKDNAHVTEVRGSGLLVGIQLDVPAGPLAGLALFTTSFCQQYD